MTRVLVVDDSQFFRTVVGNALTDDGYTVETAEDGFEAVELNTAFDPDVVTMDVEMPELDGIDAVERITSVNPVPIIMASAYTEANADETFDALEAGAVDFLEKPDGSGSRNIAHFVDELREKIEQFVDADASSLAGARTSATERATQSRREQATRSRVRISPRSSGSVSETGTGAAATRTASSSSSDGDSIGSPGVSAVEPGSAPNATPESPADDPSLATAGLATDTDDTVGPTIVIGASTGGPKIVEQLCERLPTALDARLFIVQHMPADFTSRFANRLNDRSPYDVSEARDGDWVDAGEGVVAPGDADLEITTAADGALRVRLVEERRDCSIQPSIDATMQTAAKYAGSSLCGVVLTGMGNDGAAGIEAVNAADGHTIAQDESTSPVFGIPCQAIQTGCVDTVAPAHEIADEIVTAFTATGESDD